MIKRISKGIFQFPVGMSNRSYQAIKAQTDKLTFDFQFPVGMSNRSYTRK